MSAGVKLDGSNRGAIFSDRVVLGVMAGRVLGKFLGVFGGARLSVRLGLARLSGHGVRRRSAACRSRHHREPRGRPHRVDPGGGVAQRTSTQRRIALDDV
ncbi:Na+/H+ antiporter NhaA [Nonomuraea sp. NPDC049709]|uniref:Na+/H+ antiporter NhaA n=1 Tax=Nonomuraea sp. NPDC049709 TaxID=3154736 RepID=UPI003442C065